MAHRLKYVPGVTVYELVGQARKGRLFFICSMGDMCFEKEALLFDEDGRLAGMTTTAKVQEQITRFCAEDQRHTYLLLTKRPELLDGGVDWPSNVHLGVSVTATEDAERVAALWEIRRRRPTRSHGVIWASVEPLLDPEFDPDILCGVGWVVVGAQTGPGAPDVLPVIEAAKRIVKWCAETEIPCFTKDNLRKWSIGPDDAWNWPREFPSDH